MSAVLGRDGNVVDSASRQHLATKSRQRRLRAGGLRVLGLPPSARVVGWAGSLPFWRPVGGSSRLPGTGRVVLSG